MLTENLEIVEEITSIIDHVSEKVDPVSVVEDRRPIIKVELGNNSWFINKIPNFKLYTITESLYEEPSDNKPEVLNSTEIALKLQELITDSIPYYYNLVLTNLDLETGERWYLPVRSIFNCTVLQSINRPDASDSSYIVDEVRTKLGISKDKWIYLPIDPELNNSDYKESLAFTIRVLSKVNLVILRDPLSELEYGYILEELIKKFNIIVIDETYDENE